MSKTWALCCKETRLYLTTSTSYCLFACFLLITSFFFQRLAIEYQLRTLQAMQVQDASALEQMNLTDWVMGPLFLNITVFFLFMLPILTMRLIAEERRHKTLELLMTAPLRPADIVLGKFLAASFMMAIMLALTAIFPILLHTFGTSTSGSPIDWHSVGTAYLGMFLMGMAFVSVGLFASSLSESQMVAVLVSFGALLMFYVIGLAARGQEGIAQSLLNYLSLNTHLEGFIRGMIRSVDVAYYLSLTFLSLFATHQVIDAQRYR